MIMRALFGCGTPKEAASGSQAFLFVVQTENTLLFAFIGQAAGQAGILLIAASAGEH